MLRRIVKLVVMAVASTNAVVLLFAPLQVLSRPAGAPGVGGLIRDVRDTALVGIVDRYLGERDAAIDRLLPNGSLGTLVETLPLDRDGVANASAAQVEIAAVALQDLDRTYGTLRGERVEVHERAHLLDYAYQDLVARLMAKLSTPDTAEYAATNAQEHFAETLSAAWGILAGIHATGYCPDPRQALRDAEAQIPGTAGALRWLLPIWAADPHRPIDAGLMALSDSLSVGTHAEWDALAAAVEARRLADGTLAPWSVPTIGETLVRVQKGLRYSSRRSDRLFSVVILPSAWVGRLLSG